MKTQLTLDIEKTLYEYCLEKSYFVVEEVSLPQSLGIVDTLALAMSDLEHYQWRCYEIKVSKSDFRSSAQLSFHGHYNYFVLPLTLYEKVAAEIPEKVGVLVYRPFASTLDTLTEQTAPGFLTLVKKPQVQEPTLGLAEFFPFFLSSLQREVTKAKNIEKGLKIYGAESLYNELKKRLAQEELAGKLLQDLSASKLAQLESENRFLKEQLATIMNQQKLARRKTRPYS